MPTTRPKLSVITVAYNMPRQAFNTTYSLSIHHQQNVSEADYEILLMENRSSHTVDSQALTTLGSNIRHVLRNEPSQSPTPAINEGFALARGDSICFIIDAARMVTPRVIEYALLARQMDADSIFSVPSYNLGPCEHQYHNAHGYNAMVEERLLAASGWRQNGYRLFDICNLSEANSKGIFHPVLESNCLCTSRRNFERIGLAHPAFMLPGGGSINLHMFRSLALLDTTRHFFVAPGEGSFHQFHAGITTCEDRERDTKINAMRAQLNSFWAGHYQPVSREPQLLGAVPSHAQPWLARFSQLGRKRFGWRQHSHLPAWQDDAQLGKNTGADD